MEVGMAQQRKTRWGRNNNHKGTLKNPNYRRWSHMRNRCYLKDNPEYPRYGAKGVKVFDEWLMDFNAYDNYIMSLPNALEPGYTIDRIDPSGNYEPGNLRWASKQTQSRNCKLGKNNKSGVTGVSKCSTTGKWRATITVDRKSISLGRFDILDDAIAARKAAEKKYKF
jgi:hypothetical protein